MRFMDVIYYQYLLFYKNILKVPEPFYNTMLVLGACQSFLLNGLLDIIVLKFYCYQIPTWLLFCSSIIIIYFNYIIFIKRNRARKIFKEKPLIWNNKPLSIVTSILFFLTTISWLFWGGIYGKYLLSLCR